jgi:hypothetical protein
VVALLFKTGDQVPEMPLVEVVGKADNVSPAQIGAIGVNVGVIIGFTVIVKVCVLTHCPDDGVKVYVVVVKLFKAGDQVPEIPLMEVVGKADNVPPAQIGAIGVNVGVIIGFTTIVKVCDVAHCPADGVKV